MSLRKALLAASATLVVCGAAQAGVIDLGIGGANVFTAGNFKGSNNGSAGAIVAGGNVELTSFGLNKNSQTAYGGYALVAGGSLSMSNGSLNNGMIYVGNGSALAGNVGRNGVSDSALLPLAFAETAAHAAAVSGALDGLAATGNARAQYGGLYLTGSNQGLEVFDLLGSDLTTASWLNVSGIAAGATVIVNVNGAADGLIRSLGSFNGANVLYNFTDALNLKFSSIDLAGSMLAPHATITGGNGQIGGNVVAANWDATLTLRGDAYFRQIEAAGYALAPASGSVPLPSSLLLLAAGALAAAGVRRAQSARSKP